MHQCYCLSAFWNWKWTSSSQEANRTAEVTSKHGRHALEALREVRPHAALWCIHRVNPPCSLTGIEMVVGDPSPHAAEIGAMGWKKSARLNFKYRTQGEAFSHFIASVPRL